MIDSRHAFNVTLLQANAHSRENQIILGDWSIFRWYTSEWNAFFRIHQNLPTTQSQYREIH
jgi:hypothetical protein